MFKPRYNYTDNIVNNLTRIAEARTIILNAPLIPKWEVSLRRDALLRSAHSSTAIEGNPLSLEQVSDLAAGREVMVGRKDKQEVLNYLEALEKIPTFAENIPLTGKDFLRIHKIVTKKTLDAPKYEGAYREIGVYVGNRITGEVVFMPPSEKQVPKLTDEFLQWFNSEDTNSLDPVIQAGITHYEIVRIHPFVDGNGRAARVMATLVLYNRGFDLKRFFALDDYYDNDRPSYYAALNAVDKNTQDLTKWLEYFTEGVTVSIKAVKQRVIGLSKDVKVLKERGQVQLTERQMKIVEHIIEGGAVTNRKVREMFGLSNRGALDELEKLMKLRVIKKTGKGRDISYELA